MRVDSWVSAGLTIPAAYDPMLAKILVWAPTREAAIPALGQALKDCEVGGIPTNLSFLHEAIGLESFQGITHHTKTADGVTLPGQSIEVLSPHANNGTRRAGTAGHWHVGVPPPAPSIAGPWRTPIDALAMTRTFRGWKWSWKAQR